MSRKLLLLAATVLCSAAFVHAQNGQSYYGNAYQPQMMSQPYGYLPPAYSQPVQRMQYPYYGSYPTPYSVPAAPTYTPAYNPGYRMPMRSNNTYNPAPPYGYNTGYGVNYYWTQNPMGFSSTPAPYSAVANNNALGRETIIQDPTLPMESDEHLPEALYPQPPGAAANVPYHRKPNEKFWASAEYIGMFFRPMRQSGPLLTTGDPRSGTPGVLSDPATAVLLGNQTVDHNLLSGARLTIGTFLDCDNRYSIEATGFWLSPVHSTYNFASDENGNPAVSRPVFNTADFREGAFVTSLPNTVKGAFSADFKGQMGGFEINARMHEYIRERLHVDGLFGFRYLRLREELQILERLTNLQAGFLTFRGGTINQGDVLVDDDLFKTTNQFFGPQIGGRVNWEHKWLTGTAYGKLGLGVTHQKTDIAGTTTLVTPTSIDVAQGGILALPTNNGSHTRTVFGILPEFGLEMGVELTQHTRLKFGYSVLMWNHVVRPGGQFDRNVNPNQVPGSPTFGAFRGAVAPIYRANDEFFWAHSFNLGLEFHY